MGYRACRTWRMLVLAAAALLVNSCGVTSTSPSKSPTTPVANTNNVASGPVLAAWWDAGVHGMRMVFGVAGAAYQGPLANQDVAISSGRVCMRGNIALLTGASGEISSMNIPQGTPVSLTTTALKNPQIVFSPSCTAALVYSGGVSNALLIQRLSSNPQGSAKTTQLALPAGVTAAIVGDSGSILVSVAGAGQSSPIEWLAAGSTSAQPIASLAQFGAMAFLPGKDTALLADAGTNSISEVSLLTDSMSLEQIAGEGNGVSKPIAIAASADGRMAAVINQGKSAVLRLDLSGQSAATETGCSCSPSELEPLAGNFEFRVNEPGAGTVWEFDGDASIPRMVFLPAPMSTASGNGALR